MEDKELLLNQLRNLNTVSTNLIQCQTIEDVVQMALEEVRNKLQAQVASIFLFTKDGVIKRAGINGIDKNGNPIGDSWLGDEQYYPRESFSGKAVPSFESQSGYGEPQYSNTLDLKNDYPDMINGKPYLDKLGKLECAISVPLNGSHRTFGTLEVINKIGLDRFTSADVYWLILIGTSVANILSEKRRIQHREILFTLIEQLIDLEVTHRNFNLKNTYNLVANKLISEFTPYKVCIIRIFNEKQEFDIEAKAYTDDISWQGRRDASIKAGSQIVGEVCDTKEPQFIVDVQSESNLVKYNNKEWIKQNDLKSHACLPLLVKGECVGTISVYTKYQRKFYDNDKLFLRSVAFLIAATTARVRLINELREVRKQLNDENDRFLSASRALGYSSVMQGFIHQYKNELIDFNLSLQKLLSDSNTSQKEKDIIINNKMDWIKKRFEEITLEFQADSSDLNDVEINSLIKNILKTVLFDAENNIEISEKYYPDIPLIRINEFEIRDVIYNLVTNAIASVNRDNKKDKKILISTDIITSDQTQYIQIIVEDNGVGIRNEDREKVFKKGFTTRKNEGGTGMGLFLTREILDKYVGKIRFESTVGKGAKFFVNLPVNLLMKRYQIKK